MTEKPHILSGLTQWSLSDMVQVALLGGFPPIIDSGVEAPSIFQWFHPNHVASKICHRRGRESVDDDLGLLWPRQEGVYITSVQTSLVRIQLHKPNLSAREAGKLGFLCIQEEENGIW